MTESTILFISLILPLTVLTQNTSLDLSNSTVLDFTTNTEPPPTTTTINYYLKEQHQKPCSPFDTINITAGTKNSDDSITHNGITYEKNEYAYYNYIFKNQSHKIKVPKHIRGCICLHRICVRSCCLENEIWNSNINKCVSNNNTELSTFNATIRENGEFIDHNLQNSTEYGIVFGKICPFYILFPHETIDDTWILSRVKFNCLNI